MEAVKRNLEDIHSRIALAAERSGRKSEEITLVTVTKTVAPEKIMEAYSFGERTFGENRVQELEEKYPLKDDVSWHLIGHLQTNKVKYVVGKASLIHSVDSLKLLEAINQEAKKKGIVQKILLEVNISGEESKYGLTIGQIPTIMDSIDKMDGVSFEGFMTMAPLGAEKAVLKTVFSGAKKLFDEYKEYGAKILSMGMSGDFETAIEEGATHIRIGSAIFRR